MDPSLTNVLSSAEVQAFASGFPVMVTHLIVTCACGEKIELECLYTATR